AQWYTVSGYNPLTRSLRIYLADTASHPSDENPAMESYEHLFTIEHLDPDSPYRFKMYRVAYTTLPPDYYLFVGYDVIQSSLLYDRPLIVDKVSALAPEPYFVPEHRITVSGRVVTIRTGVTDDRVPLSCTLLSVDGRCITRCRTGEQQNKVTMIAPGRGVYLLRIRNGNGLYRTSRIVIAR
ncbi:MAG: hypothetical protein JW913_02845, partial [Chitinispirillaceae bacterium]|nr:hypothetical protein [Chitinispirillaceae bacterium]